MFNIFHMEKKEDAGIITKPLENIMTCEYNVQFKIAYSLMNEPVGLCLGLEIRILIKNIPMKTTFLFDSMIAMVTTFLSPQCIFFLPLFSPRLDGHQGINALNYVQSTLFDALANMLFENPENIPDHVCEIFQQIDTTYCEEKAELLRQITAPSRRACFCGSRRSDLHHENLFLGCGCVLSLLCIHNNQLLLAGLGDCGIVFSIGGRARYALQRHNPTDALEKQRILVEFGETCDADGGRQRAEQPRGQHAGGFAVDRRRLVQEVLPDAIVRVFTLFIGFIHCSAQRSDPRQDVVIAEPDVKIYPLSSGTPFMLLCITRQTWSSASSGATVYSRVSPSRPPSTS